MTNPNHRRDAARLRQPEGVDRTEWRRATDEIPDVRQLLVVYDGEVRPAELEGRSLYLLSSRGESVAMWPRVEWWMPMPDAPDG